MAEIVVAFSHRNSIFVTAILGNKNEAGNIVEEQLYAIKWKIPRENDRWDIWMAPNYRGRENQFIIRKVLCIF